MNGSHNTDNFYERRYDKTEIKKLAAFIIAELGHSVDMHILQSGLEAVEILRGYRKETASIGCGNPEDLNRKKITDDLQKFFEYYQEFLNSNVYNI